MQKPYLPEVEGQLTTTTNTNNILGQYLTFLQGLPQWHSRSRRMGRGLARNGYQENDAPVEIMASKKEERAKQCKMTMMIILNCRCLS